MLEWIKQFVSSNPTFAPYVIALLLFIAGFSIPISADIVILVAASLAATLLKGSFLKLYLAVFIGSSLAAYAAYCQGRFLGSYLLTKPFFKKLFPQKRLDKIAFYYKKHSWPTLLIGRFIPFGFRNALFVTVGLSKISFKSFAFKDLFACLLWSLTLFSTLFHLVSQVDDVLSVIKKFNLIIFSLLALTFISLVWYKQIKKRRLTAKNTL